MSSRAKGKELWEASTDGKLDDVGRLLNSGAPVDWQDAELGRTALYRACGHGHTDVVRLLVERGAMIDLAVKDGWTPLHVASHRGHFDVVRFLVERGVKIDLAENDGWTPLHLASQQGHIDVVRLLVERGAKIESVGEYGCTPLYGASRHGRTDVVRFLVERGAKIDLAEEDGCTPLYIACHNGHIDVVRLLVECGAKIELAVNDGPTPLFVACENGHTDVVRLLVERGAMIDLAVNGGWTPLQIASQEEQFDVVRLLVERGAKIDLADEDGATPLKVACQEGHIDVARLLVERGALIDLADMDGVTPLYMASRNGHSEVVSLLVERGANLGLADNGGTTPLSVARCNGHDEVVRLLTEEMWRRNGDTEHDLFQCGICIESMNATERVPALCPGCGQSFCLPCLERRVADGLPCPLCRSALPRKLAVNTVLRDYLQRCGKRKGDHVEEELPMIAASELLLEQTPVAFGATEIIFRGEYRHTRVVVKVPHAVASDARAEHGTPADVRLRREGSMLLRLRHPQIVTVFGLTRLNCGSGLVVEYLQHGELGRWIQEHRATLDARAISLSLLRAVSYIHSLSLMHGDLKPGNVLIADEHGKTVKVAGFGHSRHTLGTLAYCAPECLAGSPVGLPADVYALGILLWNVFAGVNNPYAGVPDVAVPLAVVQRGLRPDLSKVPAPIGPILSRVWAVAPTSRPRVAELTAEFERATIGL